MYEVLDDTAAQVILATESGDSIRRVAQHLHAPYEIVRQAVNRLEDAGYVRYDDGLSVVDDRVRDVARELVAASAAVSPPSIEEAYVIPQFGDWPFAFTRIDAVYVWTRGGYQVSRDSDDYPLFIAVREQDVDAWETFFASFGLPTAFERQPSDEIDGALQIVLNPHPSLEVEDVEGYPVIPREDTIEYMLDHYAQFQSALAMLDRMYEDLDLGVAYRESEGPVMSFSNRSDALIELLEEFIEERWESGEYDRGVPKHEVVAHRKVEGLMEVQIRQAIERLRSGEYIFEPTYDFFRTAK